MDATIVGSIIGAIGGIGGAYWAARASIRAGHILRVAAEQAEARKAERQRDLDTRQVQVEAFEQARRFYDDVIQRLEHDLQRVTAELGRIRDELDRERTVSDELRARLRGVEDTVHEMRAPIQELKHQAEQQPPQAGGRFTDWLGQNGGDLHEPA